MSSLHTFHFDLSHFCLSADHPLVAKVAGKRIPLCRHDDDSLNRLRSINGAADVLLDKKSESFTHFADLSAVPIQRGKVHKLTVTGHADEEHPTEYLPRLYYVGNIFHREEHLTYLRKLHLEKGPFLPAVLHLNGISLSATNNPLQWLEDTYHLKGPQDIALYLSGHHPRLLTSKSQVAMRVLHEHVFPIYGTDPESINQVNSIGLLTQAIQSQGPAGWTTIEQTVDLYGKKMTYGFDFKEKNGTKVYRKSGDAVLKYVLTQQTESFMAGTLGRPIQTTRGDGTLQNHLWAVNQGKTTYDNANLPVPPGPVRTMAAMNGATANYLVSPNTHSHGIWADQASIKIEDYKKQPASTTKTVSIDTHNYFMRSVGAYVQFFSDPDFTHPIDKPADWEEQLPQFLRAGFETDSKKYVALASSVNSIMGIPTPTDPTVMTFNWPGDAQSAKLLFGGVGTSNWDDHIVWPGFISTGIFNFGLPVFMMVAGAAVTSTQWYKKFAEDTAKLLAVGSSAGFLAFGPMAGVKGLPYTLAKFGDIIGGLLVSKGMEVLMEKIILRVTAAAAIEEVPFAGWAIRAASMVLDAALIAVSLGEVLSSPAVIEVGLKRQMKLSFTLHPDLKHGESGKPATAIWPAVGNNYRILVSYKNGTTFEAKGKVPLSGTGGPSNQPIKAEFTVPWGGQLEVMAGIYSKNDWLCGKYQGPRIDASPGANTPGELDLTGNITEIMVPLTQDTQYKFKWKIAYDKTNQHHWFGTEKGAAIPTTTVNSLSSSPVGNNIGDLGVLTINRSAYVLGYVWRGSNEQVGSGGQEWIFQNISVLSDPESRLKFPTKGFGSNKPGLAYDLYGGTEKAIGPLNFVIDTSQGSNGYLRHVDIVDGKPDFGLQGATESYGVFTLGDIDDVAIHPKGYVVAANWNDHRLQILPLAAAAVPDKDAPHAVVVSNKGILEGLVQGPKALSIDPDGKILVLETANERIQAFDLKGNPAPAFTGAHLFNDTKGATYVTALDAKQTPPGLVEEFIDNRITDLFVLPLGLAAVLDADVMTKQLIDAFADNMIYLSYESNGQGGVKPDPKLSSFITVIDSGRIWQVTDPGRDMVYHIATEGGGLQVYDLFQKTRVTILTKGSRWQLEDITGARSYLLELDKGTLSVSEYKSYFGINPKAEQLTYCDVACEGKGYIYVLAYHGTPKGNVKNSDYVMDVYTPQGKFLFRTPDTKLSGVDMQYIAAGKIAIDYFRNLFTLNYEIISGPGGRTEPSVSQWSPTPPLFELVPADATVLDAKDIAKVVKLFATHKTTLSANSTIVVIAPGQHWSVSDPKTLKHYDVITSIKKIYVYDLPQ